MAADPRPPSGVSSADPGSQAPPPAVRRPAGASARLGAVALLLLALGTVVILSYTLLDLPWQQRLGGWNYLIALAFLLSTSLPVRLWQPDPRYPTPGSVAGTPRTGG